MFCINNIINLIFYILQGVCSSIILNIYCFSIRICKVNINYVKKSDLSEDDIMLSFNVCLNYLYIFYEILIKNVLVCIN